MFGEYVDEEVLDKIIDGAPFPKPSIQSGRIEYIFALLRSDSPEQLSTSIGLVTEMGMKYEAVVDSIAGPLVVLSFGQFGYIPAMATARASLVSGLQEQFGRDAKIVHGTADGHFGLFGGLARLAHTFTFSRFDQVLGLLGSLDYGQTQELKDL